MGSEPSGASGEGTEPTDQPPRRRKGKGRVYILAERCKGCGYCVEFCPSDALALAQGFNKKGYHPPEVADSEACNGCDLCGMYCPDFAIYGVRIKGGQDKTADEDE